MTGKNWMKVEAFSAKIAIRHESLFSQYFSNQKSKLQKEKFKI